MWQHAQEAAAPPFAPSILLTLVWWRLEDPWSCMDRQTDIMCCCMKKTEIRLVKVLLGWFEWQSTWLQEKLYYGNKNPAEFLSYVNFCHFCHVWTSYNVDSRLYDEVENCEGSKKHYMIDQSQAKVSDQINSKGSDALHLPESVQLEPTVMLAS